MACLKSCIFQSAVSNSFFTALGFHHGTDDIFSYGLTMVRMVTDDIYTNDLFIYHFGRVCIQIVPWLA